jgi:hypothetical protein
VAYCGLQHVMTWNRLVAAWLGVLCKPAVCKVCKAEKVKSIEPLGGHTIGLACRLLRQLLTCIVLHNCCAAVLAYVVSRQLALGCCRGALQ